MHLMLQEGRKRAFFVLLLCLASHLAFATHERVPENEEEEYSLDKVVCAVITTKQNHRTKAVAVKETWGSRCGTLLFISADEDSQLPTIAFPGSEEGHIINKKVFNMWSYVYEHYGSKNWFIKADDDVYIHLDNLMAMLKKKEFKPTEDHYIGRKGYYRGVEYCGGGAGYVLSRGLLQKWAPHVRGCQQLPVGEDVSVGKCIKATTGVSGTFVTGFYHQTPDFFLRTAQGKEDHPEGLSPRPISFHYITPPKMYELHYLLHTTQVIDLPSSSIWSQDPWPEHDKIHDFQLKLAKYIDIQ